MSRGEVAVPAGGDERLNCSFIYSHWYECLASSSSAGSSTAAGLGDEGSLVDVILPPLWAVAATTLTIVLVLFSTRWVFMGAAKRTRDYFFETLGQARHRRLILPPQAVLRPAQLEKGGKSKLSLTTRTRQLLTPKSKRHQRQSSNGGENGLHPSGNGHANGNGNGRAPFASNIIDASEVPADFTPLVVFVNRKSGGQKGSFLYEQLRRNLNPQQVFDLSKHKPERILKIFSHVPNVRVLVCGGDGSIRWVLSAIESLDLKQPIPVAVLPLGTGNDLARVLGWGPGYNRDDNIPETLVEVKDAHKVLLDRWEIQLQQHPHQSATASANGNGNGGGGGGGGRSTRRSGSRKSRQPEEPKSIIFNNYFGIGVDATTALRFHETRNKFPEWFFSRVINKLWYVLYGAREIVDRSCSGMASQIRVLCDGEEVEIPREAEGIIILNINSFAGGVKMWNDRSTSYESLYQLAESFRLGRSFGRSSMHDGMLDVVAVNGSFHLGQVNVGLARPIPLCQGKEITIESTCSTAMQVDGEPWTQKPCHISVSHRSQAHMLRKTVDTNGEAALRMQELLNWASDKDLLMDSQHQQLLREMSRRFL